jgi:hypothetical protein
MFLPRAQREELNALSKEIFGVSSRWNKILKNGTREVAMRKVTETVPGVEGAPDTEREVVVPVLIGNGTPKRYQKYYTVDEVTTLLLGIKSQMDAQKAGIKKAQEEQAAAAQVKDLAQGSAV